MLGATLVAAAVLVGPALSAPTTRAAGTACAEGPRHLWSLAVAGQSLWAGTGARRRAAVGWPGGFDGPLLDPVGLLITEPAAALGGPALAWNALLLAAVLLAGLGAWRLGRRAGLDSLGMAALATGTVLAPWLLQFGATGRTELLAAALWPLHLAALDRARQGAWGASLGAAASLALMGAAGPSLALFVALAAGPLLLAWLVRGGARGPLLAAALGGLLGALPALLPVLTELPAAAARWGPASPGLAAPVQTSLQSWLHTVPASLQPPTEQPATAGLALVLLALLGARRHPAARGWLALAAWILLWAQGTAPTAARDVGAAPATVWGPVAAVVRAVPPLGAVASWSRIGCLLGVALGIAAAHGAQGLRGRWRALGWALVLVAAAEQLVHPRPPSGATFAAVPPADHGAALATLPPGPVVQLPLALPLGGRCPADDRWLLWSLAHDRPVTATPAEVADTARQLGTFGQLMEAVQRGRLGPPRQVEAALAGCVREALHKANNDGLQGVLVDTRDPVGRTQAAWLAAVLGPPLVPRARFATWPLGAVRPPATLAPVCRLPAR